MKGDNYSDSKHVIEAQDTIKQLEKYYQQKKNAELTRNYTLKRLMRIILLKYLSGLYR